MSIFYKSLRIGKHGKEFVLWKFRTLKENTDRTSSFAREEQYTWCGRFLRKTKLDELPQILNVLRGELNLVGPRAEEKKTIEFLPEDMKRVLLSRRPGLTSLASIHFFDEGQILENARDPHRTYWENIKPLKFTLDAFYIQNRDIFLDFWIIWKTAVLVVISLLKSANPRGSKKEIQREI